MASTALIETSASATVAQPKADHPKAAQPKVARPLVIVVILHWNRYQDTHNCLETLQQATYRPLQVLVADNGSTDSSVEQLAREFPEVEFVLNGANLGFARGNNPGIRRALEMGADYVFLLNNDVVVAPDFLEPLIEAGEAHPEAGALSGTVYNFNASERTRKIFYAGGAMSYLRGGGICFRFNQTDDLPNDRPAEKVGFVSGCSMLVKRAALERVGLLDEDFFFGVEDEDYSWRLTKAGYDLLYVPRSVIWHKSWGSRSFRPGEFYNAIVSKAILMRKHCPAPLFYLWWSLYGLRLHLGMGRLLRYILAKHGLAPENKPALRDALLAAWRNGYSRQAQSSFTIPSRR